jgi:hypothetical protein
LGISFISKWLLTEQNGSELNGTERKATCFYPYLPPSLYLFLRFPFHSAPLRFVNPDNDIEILSHFISLPPSPSRSVIPVCHWSGYEYKRNGAERKAMEPKDLVTNKLLVWVSRSSLNGTERI